jgi:hypothetical protein
VAQMRARCQVSDLCVSATLKKQSSLDMAKNRYSTKPKRRVVCENRPKEPAHTLLSIAAEIGFMAIFLPGFSGDENKPRPTFFGKAPSLALLKRMFRNFVHETQREPGLFRKLSSRLLTRPAFVCFAEFWSSPEFVKG